MADPRPTETAAVRQFCTFRLGRHLCGVDIRGVKEVNTHTAFTRVPHAPSAVCGYVNLRGQIYLAVDLRNLLGLDSAPVTPDSRLIIFKPALGEAFGGLVDRVGDIVTLGPDAIEDTRTDVRSGPDPADRLGRAGRFVAGVGKLDGELVVLMRAEKFLDAVRELVQGKDLGMTQNPRAS